MFIVSVFIWRSNTRKNHSSGITSPDTLISKMVDYNSLIVFRLPLIITRENIELLAIEEKVSK